MEVEGGGGTTPNRFMARGFGMLGATLVALGVLFREKDFVKSTSGLDVSALADEVGILPTLVAGTVLLALAIVLALKKPSYPPS